MIKTRRKRSIVWTLDSEKFRELALNCQTLTEFSIRFNATYGAGRRSEIYGTGYYALKNRVIELGLLEHFSKNKRKRQSHYLRDINDYEDRASFKKRIIRDNLIDYKCAICGNEGEWLGKPLSLQLDHINGIAHDHHLTNVRFLCPNCHSQTDSFTGRNKGRNR